MQMSDWFLALDPLSQALLATLFTWGLTAAGAGLVFLTRTIDRHVFDAMLGAAAGVMIAASYFSLLAPAIALAEERGSGVPWVPAVVGFLAGGLFMRLVDSLLPHLHPQQPLAAAEGMPTTWRRSVLLVSAITLHNFPEGLAVGVAFGSAAAGYPEATVASAVALAIGIGLQNFPEGAAVSFPLRREGMPRGRAFFWGQLSAAVEPPAALLGVAAVSVATPILPYALAFAAGAMIFVVVEELIPESQAGGHADLATVALLFGFAVMMTLDVALG
jgi:ZIP family zinc transporter